MTYLGRGFDDIAGKPFGWAYYEEAREIRERLRGRGARSARWDGVLGPGALEFRVAAIQRRIHKNKPTMRERQDAARAAAVARPTPESDLIVALREIAAGHNDARGRAAAALERAGL